MKTIYEKHEEFLKQNESIIKVKDGILFRGKINHGKGDYSTNRGKGDVAKNWEIAPRRYLYITKELTENQKGWDDIRNEDGFNKNGYDITGRFYRNYMYHLYGMESAIENNKFVTWENLSHDKLKDCVKHFFQYEAALARINCGKDFGPISTNYKRLKELIEVNGDLLKQQINLLDADIIVCCGSDDLILNLVYDTYSEANWKYYRGGIHYSEEIKKIIVHSYHMSYYGIGHKDFYEDTVKPFAEFIKKHHGFRSFR